jgi:hypothetical protein
MDYARLMRSGESGGNLYCQVKDLGEFELSVRLIFAQVLAVDKFRGDELPAVSRPDFIDS